MANLTIKGVPDQLVAELKKEAAARRRSLNGEVLHRLERSLDVAPDSASGTAAALDRVREVRERARVETAEDVLAHIRRHRVHPSGQPFTVRELKAAIEDGRE